MVPISHVDYAFRPAWLPAYVQTEVYDNYIVPCAVLSAVAVAANKRTNERTSQLSLSSRNILLWYLNGK